MDFLSHVVFELMIWQWILLVGGSILFLLVSSVLLKNIIERVESVAEHSHTDVDDFLLALAKKITTLTKLATGVWILLQFLPVAPSFTTWARVIFLFCLYLQIGIWAPSIFSFLFRKFAADEEGNSRAASLAMLVKILSWITYIILFVMAIDALPGIEITTLVATLGIGGIAVAFALQNVLSDFAAALTIALDQPFQVGDSIEVDGLGGSVEKIGLKSTRIRAWDGQEIIFSNDRLLNNRIHNFKSLERRRVVMNLRVVYQTKTEDLDRIPSLVERIISAFDQVTYERTHSTSLNASWIEYECLYHVDSADFKLFMDIRHQINVGILRCFEEEGIQLAYPTQTIFVEK
jgi:small-conductance mechanosensitive channel